MKKEINFMGLRKIAMIISIILVIAAITLVSTKGVKRGVQFIGGTEIQVRFKEAIPIDELRKAFHDGGFKNASIVRIDEEGVNEFIIKITGDAGDETKKGSHVSSQINSIFKKISGEKDEDGKFDVNKINLTELTTSLVKANPLNFEKEALIGETNTEYSKIAENYIAFRDSKNFFDSLDEATTAFEKQELKDYLKANFYSGNYLKLKEDTFSPSISKEQTSKAIQAMIMALISILIYVSIRFKFAYAIGAITALVHDVLITLGMFVLFDQEFSLPVVAAFLTIIGYSLNDTIVVFDRVRENLKLVKTKPLLEVLNRSLNQTLSRTLLTSLTTLFVVVILFFFGGVALKNFSFPLLVGIIVGTYSSIYIASPVYHVIELKLNKDMK